MRPLQIARGGERRLVAIADAALAPLAWRRPAPTRSVRRILVLRLERIGDLLMTIQALGDVRAAWPDARIDLAVGAWNAPLAAALSGIDRVLTLSAPWLARHEPAARWTTTFGTARSWRTANYDLVINFEPDIRSNLIAWLTRAPVRVGYWTGGGGACLTHAIAYEPAAHVLINARTLVAHAVHALRSTPAVSTQSPVMLRVPENARAAASALLAGRRRPLIGVHASGGRLSKQWPVGRFAEVARTIAAQRGATLVLTGTEADRLLVDELRSGLPGVPVLDLCGAVDLLTLAGVLEQLDLFVTGDTGPMHLAAAVGTAVVAMFGPSDPDRYGPLIDRRRILRVDLPCSPCGLVRLPPPRCRGHVPECLDRLPVDRVVEAACDLLDRTPRAHATTGTTWP
jgi:lipopolysaccharide heptosyltransferase II